MSENAPELSSDGSSNENEIINFLLGRRPLPDGTYPPLTQDDIRRFNKLRHDVNQAIEKLGGEFMDTAETVPEPNIDTKRTADIIPIAEPKMAEAAQSRIVGVDVTKRTIPTEHGDARETKVSVNFGQGLERVLDPLAKLVRDGAGAVLWVGVKIGKHLKITVSKGSGGSAEDTEKADE